jgi:Tol biopolymer transport system component
VPDDRLTQQLRRAADYGAEKARGPDPGAIWRRGRSRRRRRLAVAAATACLLAGGLVIGDTVDLPEPAEPALPSVTAPASFLAEVGGRVAVVSTANGQVVRYLTGQPAGQFAFAPNERGDTVWFSDSGACPSLYRIPSAGGAAIKVDAALNAESIAISQDGSKLAYRPFGCSGPSTAIGVLDLRTGEKRTWSYSARGEVLGPMTWSPDGRHLAFVEFFGTGELRFRAWLLDTLGPGASLSASRPVPAPDSGCHVRDLAWQPGSGLLAISESCPANHQLVYVDAPGGRPLARPVRSDQTIAGLDFDPSGRHLLYLTGEPNLVGNPSTWRYDGTRAVEIGRGFGGPAW